FSALMPRRYIGSASNTAYEIPDEAKDPAFPGILGIDDRRPAGPFAGPDQRNADGQKPGNPDQGQLQCYRGQPAAASGAEQPLADSAQGEPRQRSIGPIARSVPERFGQRHGRSHQ